VYGELFDFSKILNTCAPKNVYDVNYILNKFDEGKVCHGLSNNNEYNMIKTTFGPNKSVESFGRIRHANCAKIISEEKAGYLPIIYDLFQIIIFI